MIQVAKEFFKDIKELKLLTDKLRKNRLSKDGFNLDLYEPEFKLDNYGNPIDSCEIEKLRSHEMIEESMLLANNLAAKQIEITQSKLNRFGIYRNHENLSMKNENFLKELINYITKSPVQSDSHIKAREINKFLNQISTSKKGSKPYYCKENAKANYSTKSLGHYGLGLGSYTHFTSPIRRYSDIIAHRMIKGKFNKNDNIFSIIYQCNSGELRSQNAERICCTQGS